MAAVLIIGASRGIGLATVNAALKAGYSVRALSRSASTIRLQTKLEKLDGDAVDQGHDRAGAGRCRYRDSDPGCDARAGGDPTGTRLFSTATRVLVRAMEASGARRLICVTGLERATAAAAAEFCKRRPLLVPWACVRRQRRAGANHPQEPARLDNCSSDHPNQRTAHGRI